MPAPALNIPIRADVSQFQNDMKSTSAIAGTAVRTITKGVIDMNAGFLATQGAAGAATLAFRGVLGVLGPVLLGITLVSDAFKVMGYATDLAKAKIVEWNALASAANASGVSTDFFQRFTKSAEAVKNLDDVTAALKRFNEASTDKLGGSDLQQRVTELTDAGNFGGNTGPAGLTSANSTEDKLRATISLIDQAMDKGERLAALDIAGKAFGPAVVTALQADSGYLDQMLQRADAMSSLKLVSPEDVGRAIELKERMDAAQQTLADKWKPVQDDLAKLGMNYHESWVSITETLATAVGYATALYTAIGKIPALFSQMGSAQIWKDLNNFTERMGLNSDPASLGIITDPVEIAKSQGVDKLTTALQNHGNVVRSMQQATDTQSAVRGDTSKAPAAAATDDANDAVDRAINSLRKHTEQTEADTKAVGLGDAALAKFRAEAAETAAVQANGGEETADQAAQFKKLQDQAAAAADALAKAKVASEVSTGRQTAFLTPEDAAIAKQLAGIYGNDIPAALASSEAAALRLNAGLKAMSDLGQSVNQGLFVDFETGLRNGKTAWESFQAAGVNALGKIADSLAKMAADDLWKAAFGGSTGGSLLSLFGLGGGGPGGSSLAGGGFSAPSAGATDPLSTFADGGFTGPGGKNKPAGVVHAGEFVFTQDETNRIGVGNLQAMAKGYANGGYVGGSAPSGGGAGGIHVAQGDTHINVQGSMDKETMSYVNRELAKRDAAFATNVVKTVRSARQGRQL